MKEQERGRGPEYLSHILAHNLRAIRRERKLSQRETAELTGLSINEIGRIEREKVAPRLSVLAALSKGMGIPPKRLLDPHLDPTAVYSMESGDVLEQIRRSLTGLPSGEQNHIAHLVALSASHYRSNHRW